jgi:ribosomal protein S7
MDIQLRKSSRLATQYYKNNFYRNRRHRLNRRKRRLRRGTKISLKNKLRLYVAIKARFLKKKYGFFYSKHRIDAIRFKRFLFSFSWYKKRKLWKRKLKLGFRKFFRIYLKRFSKMRRISHYNIVYNFYRTYNFYKLLRSFVKYSRLKKILRRKRRVFKSKKKVYIVKLITSDMAGSLSMLSNFVQLTISRGKKKLSFKIFLEFYTLLKFKYKTDFLIKYLEFLEKVRPLVYYKTMYISGKKYRIPVLMPIRKSYLVALRWLINSPSYENSSKRLFTLVVDSVKNEGSMIKIRKEHHSMIYENKSYTRFLRFLKKGF